MMRSSVVLAICLATSTVRADQPAVPEPYGGYGCRAQAPTSKVGLAFSPDSTVASYAAWISATTCKAVVFDSNVGKYRLKATIVAPNRYTAKAALELVIDAIEVTGLVVTPKADSYVIKLGPNAPSCPQAAAEDEPITADELDDGILEIDESTYAIDRALATKLLASPKYLAQTARIVPAMKNGKPDGVKFYAIRPGMAIAKLGFANGDTLVRVNDQPITTPESGLAVWTKLGAEQKLGTVTIHVVRRGKPFSWSILVK
jgi:hypothetical protein